LRPLRLPSGGGNRPRRSTCESRDHRYSRGDESRSTKLGRLGAI
jgi:hypothetical protein